MDIITVKNLTKTYGKGDLEIHAVNHMDLRIDKREIVAVTGTSGSGKSTLLHLLGGVGLPTSGEVIIDGEDIYALNDDGRSSIRRRKIGFVFQSYNLIPILTAEENIISPILLDKKKPDPAYIDELLEMLNLEKWRTHLPNQLSGGQQQRVAIGRALANRPRLILADEPTGNLDHEQAMEIMEILIHSVKKYQQTLVMVTHDMDLAKMCERIISIQDGRILSDVPNKSTLIL
ncbi:MAG: ABC transporter ATP-binding protein [Bacteroides sp.]|nr:ABC transporter ATP-binding protein [Bacteroides sp.]MCM1549622.1 ABC transporter ATP-binding protein [Clostridium sp.]